MTTGDVTIEPQAVGAALLARRISGVGARTVALAGCSLLGLLWLSLFAQHGGDITGFVTFGKNYASLIHPPAHAVISPDHGYDGQFYWRMAVAPLLGDHSVINALKHTHQEYRAQRILYPTLAWALALGQRALVPYTLQLIGFASTVSVVWLLASTARRHHRSAWWGLVGLLPGLYLGMARDLTDPLAVALLVATFVALERRRIAPAAIAATAAVLTRETMVFIPLALAGALAVERMDVPARLKPSALPARTWVVAAASFASYALWQVVATIRLGTVPAFTTPPRQFSGPLIALTQQLSLTAHEAAHGGPFILTALVNPLYLEAIVAAAVTAVWALTRRLDPVAICAGLFALVAVTQSYGDYWSYTRATAPLFALLALIAITRGYRRTLVFVAVGIALLPVYPI